MVAVEGTPDHATHPSLADTRSGRRYFVYSVRPYLDSNYSKTRYFHESPTEADRDSREILPCILIRVSSFPPLSTLHRAWTHQSCSPTSDLVLFPSIPSHPNRCRCSCLQSVIEQAHNHSTTQIRADPGLPPLHSVAIAGRFFANVTFSSVEAQPLLRLFRHRTGISICSRRKQT